MVTSSKVENKSEECVGCSSYGTIKCSNVTVLMFDSLKVVREMGLVGVGVGWCGVHYKVTSCWGEMREVLLKMRNHGTF